MHGPPPELNQRVPPAGLLGYLNFSDGRPDPRFQRKLNEAFALFAESGDPAPWRALARWLAAECDRLHAEGSAAFRDVSQARAVLALALERLPLAYRQHHADLLAHQPDATLFAPFFLARACEAVLQQGPPWEDEGRALAGALGRLNDFVGHRPIAVLETRPQTDFYPHERVRPIPLYLRDAGTGYGPYRELIDAALAAVRQTDPDLLEEACFHPDLLDELALDPRAYDHQHPVNRRPNYLFGEWDPHHIDGQGRYRRFVLRQPVLDALAAWVPAADGPRGGDEPSREERLREAGTVLAGTILMAAGVSGAGPEYHDSSVTLTTLVPRIARYRDRFYAEALARVGGGHGRRLRAEAEALRQPFGGARQHLNQVLARQRAEQLQERRLAVLFAEMGYPDASRQRARSIPTVSARMLAEIHLRQTACRLALERGEPAAAAGFLPQVEDLLERAIGCGALPDPWNILGFQGLFPLFQAREDSVRDTRHEELIAVVGRQLDLYAGVLAGFAAAGDAAGQDFLRRGMERFAAWWDRFATAGVGDLPRVHGGERAEAAAHVARALARWREQPGRGNEVAFWRAQREGFRSPSAFAPVIEALMHNRDHRAALALLLAWLSEAESIPLEQGDASFHDLLPRWLRATLALPPEERDAQVGPLGRVFELLEANAEAFWHAPDLPAGPPGAAAAGEEGEGEDLYRAAYEGMSYRDSTGGDEGAVIGGEPGGAADAFPLEEQAAYLEQRLKFLATLARLWQAAVASELAAEAPQPPAAHRAWLAAALAQQEGLLTFLDRLTALPVPEPAAPFETVVEFDRRQAVKQSLIELALSASVELGRAVRGLRALVGGGRGTPEGAGADALPWEAVAVRLEQAIGRADPGEVRRLLPRLVPEFRREPLLYVPIASGGSPRLVLRVRSAQAFLRTLLERLPPLGLLRETYQLLRLARSMEQNTDVQGRRVSEFDQLFRTALRTSVEALLDAAAGWGPAPPAEGGGGEEAGPLADQALADALHRITGAYLTLWVEHSQTLRLSVLEGLTDADWERQREFIREYGGDLFTAQFLSGVNLRGVLHRGVAAHLEALAEQADPLAPPRLLADLSEGRVDRAEAVARLETILYALAEHYEEYRDYNATTAQSDYGENLHQLMDFLRLKVQYERSNWRMKPLVLTHEVLCRKEQGGAADFWREKIRREIDRPARKLLEELDRLEQRSGMRLRTVRDRVEERFVRPMLLDRLCARVPALVRAARAQPGGDRALLARWERRLAAFTAPASGNGLDPPPWLRRLEEEVRRALGEAGGPEPAGPARTPPLTPSELRRQLAEWDRPLGGEGG